MICLQMGKTNMAKTPPGDFKVTTPENPLQNRRLQVKESQYLIPTYSWTLTPIPNWTYSIVTISPFNARLLVCDLSIVWIPGRDLMTNLRRMLAAKFFNSSRRWRSWSCLVIKLYGVQTQQLLQELGRTRFSITLFFTLVELCYCVTCLPFSVFKIILIYV